MINACVSTFKSTPWNNRLSEIIFQSLNSMNEEFKVEKIHGYPNKEYDLIFLCGIRVLTKSKLNIQKIRALCKYIIEFGDTIEDTRDAGADLYFYFNPSKKKTSKKKFLPKLINENTLFADHNKKLTIYIDHYKHQNLNEAIISRKAIKFVFEQVQNIKKLKIPFDVYFHSENGIELNPSKINLPVNSSQNCKILDYNEIVKYYRRTHLFFPTHRETQGMLAQEIGLCGGMTILQPWMYPIETHYQFRHLYYDFQKPLNLSHLEEILKNKNFIKDNIEHVKKHCSLKVFNNTFLSEIFNLLKINS
jgi:hypothetical protein